MILTRYSGDKECLEIPHLVTNIINGYVIISYKSSPAAGI